MFSTFSPHAHAFTTYTPHVPSPLSSSPLRNTPSPLSPRDANLPARDPESMMSSPTPASKTLPSLKSQSKSQSKAKSRSSPDIDVEFNEAGMSKSALPSPPPSRGRESVYSKRVTKANPLMNRNADEGREARRKLFLKKVREGSEEKRWRDRNSGMSEGEDEVLRAIWVAEERRREEERRWEASILGESEVEDEMLDGENIEDEVMVEEVAKEEEEELEALLGSLSQNQGMEEMLWGVQTVQGLRHQQAPDTPYGSDDEEYDHIFMDVIEEENRMASQQHQQVPGYLDTDSEMMDMS
ncbi:hypothetical protein N431DRAFT_434869 [Stipitochalara longipes BDJ]|nr:hypothetical protein N431DRAFT_434869 [Stipitochalara longipes BDJ]